MGSGRRAIKDLLIIPFRKRATRGIWRDIRYRKMRKVKMSGHGKKGEIRTQSMLRRVSSCSESYYRAECNACIMCNADLIICSLSHVCHYVLHSYLRCR